MDTKKILIAPLDWGLGHATRCTPIIKYLLSLGHEVTLAAEGDSAVLLKENFPALSILPLRGYRISYQKSGNSFFSAIIKQLPKVLFAIKNEHAWLKKITTQHHFDLIISDNRYGLHHATIPSVIMTHQVQILSGKGRLLDRMLLQFHCNRLEEFQKCWIVDLPQTPGLAGILSHPSIMPKNASYVGILSQMQENTSIKSKPNQVLLLLSGPEPQRTLLQDALLNEASEIEGYHFILVAGKPDILTPKNLSKNIQFISHLPAEPLSELIQNCEMVVCRSGYSTIMDLIRLQRKALFIPTPGQTEQEFLAKSLSHKQGFLLTRQDNVQLAVNLGILSKMEKQQDLQFDDALMRQAVDEFLGF